MTTTRDDRKTASGIEWVTNTTVIPVCSQIAQDLLVHPLAGHLVERAERLVHQQDRRLEGEGTGDRDPLLHPPDSWYGWCLTNSLSSTSSSISLARALRRALS